MAAFQINRHWSTIVSLSLKKCIPLKDLAVRIYCNEFPFKIQVFDCHDLSEDTKESAHLAMVASEMLRQSDADRRDWLMVTLRMPEMEYPCFVHLNDTWTKSLPALPKGKDNEQVSLIDEDGNALVCGKFDGLRAGVRLARQYAAETGETVWNRTAFVEAMVEVMTEFKAELGVGCL